MQMDSTVRTGPFTRLNRDSADINALHWEGSNGRQQPYFSPNFWRVSPLCRASDYCRKRQVNQIV